MRNEKIGHGAGYPLSVGFSGAVAAQRIVAVANPRSAPIQRAVRWAAEQGSLIDLTYGRRIRAILFMDSGHVVRVAISPETVLSRWNEVTSQRGNKAIRLFQKNERPR